MTIETRIILIYTLVCLLLLTPAICFSPPTIAIGIKLSRYQYKNKRESSQLLAFNNVAAAAMMTFFLHPLGNIEEAVKAISTDPNSVICTLDAQNSDEFHDSCQLLPNVVRYRANRIVTFRQDWGSSSSTGATIWNGANIAAKYFEEHIDRKELAKSRVLELGAGVGYEGKI